MHGFELQHSTQTLRAGIDEYLAGNPDLVRGDALSGEAQEFFRCHDAVHVVFGCGTTLVDEAVVKLASIFGTTGGWSVLRGYRLHESIEIYRRLNPREVLWTLVTVWPAVVRTIFRCLHQPRRWPWDDFAAELDVPLDELRSRYGIRVRGHRRGGDGAAVAAEPKGARR